MKTYLFIDGTNLYAAQYELFGPEKYLHFSYFIKEIEDKLKAKFDKIYFYASYSPQPKNPTKKQKLYLKNEALFYKSVKETKNVSFFTGYRSKTSGKEKEVDVKLTADIITFTFLNKYENLYLLTGDADFLQALFNITKYTNKKIFLICLQNKIMHKGAFYYLTNIFSFNDLKLKFHRRQKIRIIKLQKEKVIKKI